MCWAPSGLNLCCTACLARLPGTTAWRICLGHAGSSTSSGTAGLDPLTTIVAVATRGVLPVGLQRRHRPTPPRLLTCEEHAHFGAQGALGVVRVVLLVGARPPSLHLLLGDHSLVRSIAVGGRVVGRACGGQAAGGGARRADRAIALLGNAGAPFLCIHVALRSSETGAEQGLACSAHWGRLGRLVRLPACSLPSCRLPYIDLRSGKCLERLPNGLQSTASRTLAASVTHE